MAAAFAGKVAVAVGVVDGALSIFSNFSGISTRDHKAAAWEFVRFISVMDQYDFYVKSRKLCSQDPSSCADLRTPSQVAKDAVLNFINDAPRFRTGIDYFCSVDLDDFVFTTANGNQVNFKPTKLEKLRLVNVTSPFTTRVFSSVTDELICSDNECLEVLCKILVCMFAIFKHERAAYEFFSVRDYEPDVQPTYYSGPEYDARFAAAYEKALGKDIQMLDIGMLNVRVVNNSCDWAAVVEKVYDHMHRGC